MKPGRRVLGRVRGFGGLARAANAPDGIQVPRMPSCDDSASSLPGFTEAFMAVYLM